MKRLFSIDDWPVEDVAASVAQAARRVRRRMVRQRFSSVVYLGIGAAIAVTVANALWWQTSMHPQPLFAQSQEEPPQESITRLIAAHDGDGAGSVAEPQAKAVEPSALVASIQERLRAAALYDGPTDGVFSDDVAASIRAYERSLGLDETGRPSVALLSAAPQVPDAVVPTAARVIEEDYEGQTVAVPLLDVASVQKILNQKGFGPLTEDGRMGPKTRAALDAFSQSKGFEAGEGLSRRVLAALGAAAQ